MYYLVNVAYLIIRKTKEGWIMSRIIFLKWKEWPHLCLVFENNFPLPITNSII